MTAADRDRLLVRNGFFLFLIGLLTGFAVPALRNSRMGLSAHLEGVLNGIFLIVLGLVWGRFALSDRARHWLFWLAIYAGYMNWATTLFAAIFGSSRRMAIAGAGFTGEPWQDRTVEFGLVTLSLAIVSAVLIALWGLRRTK